MKNKSLLVLLIIFVCQVSFVSLISMKERVPTRRSEKKSIFNTERLKKIVKDKSGGSFTPPGTNRKKSSNYKRINKKRVNPADENPEQLSKCYVCHDFVGLYNYVLLPCKCGWIHCKCISIGITRLENDIFEMPYKPYDGAITVQFTCHKCHKSWSSGGEMKNDIIVWLDGGIITAKNVEFIRWCKKKIK